METTATPMIDQAPVMVMALKEWIDAHMEYHIGCDLCEEQATRRITFLLEGTRSNPASSAYRMDDCSWCSDAEAFACEAHHEAVRKDPPSGYTWCGTFDCREQYPHMLVRQMKPDAAQLKRLLDRSRKAIANIL